MKRPRFALVLAVTAGALALPGAASAAPAAETLRLATVGSGEEFQETAGGFIFEEKVYRRGKRVGRDRFVCTAIRASGQRIGGACRATIFLPEGKLIVSTKILFEKARGTLVVIGGTGAYRGARGTGTHRTRGPNGSRTGVTIRLA